MSAAAARRRHHLESDEDHPRAAPVPRLQLAPQAEILHLQRTAGNAAVARYLARSQLMRDPPPAGTTATTSPTLTSAPPTTAAAAEPAGTPRSEADLKAAITALTDQAKAARAEIDGALMTAAGELPAARKAVAEAEKALSRETKKKKPDAEKVTALDEAAKAAKAKLEDVEKRQAPDPTKLAELKKLRNDTIPLLDEYIKLLEAKPPEPAPAPEPEPEPEAKKSKKAKKAKPPPDPFPPEPTTELEKAKAHRERLRRWKLREQLDGLDAKLAAATTEEEKAKIEEERKKLSEELRSTAVNIKQFQGPWAAKPFVIAKDGKYDWDEGQKTWNYDTGKLATIASSACGPTSLAIIMQLLGQEDPEGIVPTGKDIVQKMIELTVRVGARGYTVHAGETGAKKYESQGTNGKILIENVKRNFGHIEGYPLNSLDDAKKEIASGRLVMWLKPGHFSVLQSYDPKQGFFVFDVGKSSNRWEKSPSVRGLWGVKGVY